MKKLITDRKKFVSAVDLALDHCIKLAPLYKEFTVQNLTEKALYALQTQARQASLKMFVLRMPEFIETKLLERNFIVNAKGNFVLLTDLGRQCKECGSILLFEKRREAENLAELSSIFFKRFQP